MWIGYLPMAGHPTFVSSKVPKNLGKPGNDRKGT